MEAVKRKFRKMIPKQIRPPAWAILMMRVNIVCVAGHTHNVSMITNYPSSRTSVQNLRSTGAETPVPWLLQ